MRSRERETSQDKKHLTRRKRKFHETDATGLIRFSRKSRKQPPTPVTSSYLYQTTQTQLQLLQLHRELLEQPVQFLPRLRGWWPGFFFPPRFKRPEDVRSSSFEVLENSIRELQHRLAKLLEHRVPHHVLHDLHVVRVALFRAVHRAHRALVPGLVEKRLVHENQGLD